MFFPLGDDNTGRRSRPVVTPILVGACIFVFVVLQGCGTSDSFTMAFSTVPEEIVTGRDVTTPDRTLRDPRTGADVVVAGLRETPVSVYLTLLTAVFMHGGIAHLVGNMVFLWIFGDNVEDDLGRPRFVTFYLVTGLVASLAHVFSTVAFGGDPRVPSLGASGAISGVLGAYLVLHPRRRVRVLVLRMITEVPAVFAIGAWFAFQVVAGLMSSPSRGGGGVAYGAHVGGFLAGLVLVKLFQPSADRGAPPPLAQRSR